MKIVTSKDGTVIAYDQSGQGSVVIFVDGALQYRAFDQGMAPLADLLAKHFTVIHYDRRGRGDSTDTQPFAIEREIEDIEALIDASGGSASLYGISSGAVAFRCIWLPRRGSANRLSGVSVARSARMSWFRSSFRRKESADTTAARTSTCASPRRSGRSASRFLARTPPRWPRPLRS